jgi:cobalamin biosynthesis protein CobD/CbiB
MVLVLIVGGFIGAAIAYLQSYFNRHDPAAGGALSVGAWFAGSAILIVWLLIDPSGILAPSLALSAALSYLLIQELCDRRAESTEVSDLASGRDQLRAAEAPHSEP